MHKLLSHTPYFIPLFGIVGMSIIGFLAFSYDHYFQTGIVVAAGFAHVAWGVVYHTIHRDLTIMIVFEYVVVATFGVAAVLTALT